jgi:hypothetical protein
MENEAKKDTIEKKKRIRGAKAYAPFGAGRETGHQIPAVAAKIKGKGDRSEGRANCRTR